MARFAAFLDACALVPVAQADTLLRLAEAQLYRPLWSDEVLEETVAAIERIHPDTKESGAARKRANNMRRFFPDAFIDDWYSLVGSVQIPDENDRHVVAAAFKGRADVIVTNNIKDFPQENLQPFGLLVQTPDEFLLNQLDLAPQLVMESLQRQTQATKNPHLQLEDLLALLAKCGARRFASAAAAMSWRIRRT